MLSSFILILFRYVYDILLEFDITNDIYSIAAQKILNSFNKSIDEGGMHLELTDDEWWFSHHEKHRFVLNGHLHTLINLYNYYYRTMDSNALEYFIKGVNSLSRLIPFFIRGTQQFYDLVGNQANYKYQALHVMQIDWLYSVTGIELFKIYHDLFLESYIISTESEIKMNAQRNNSFIELTSIIIWNKYSTGDNRLYVRGEMIFEGYYVPTSYLDIDMNVELRERKEEEVSGTNDPNSYSFQRRINIDNTITNFNIIDLEYDINYLYIQLPFSNIILTVSDDIIYRNRYFEFGISVAIITSIYIITIVYKKIRDVKK